MNNQHNYYLIPERVWDTIYDLLSQDKDIPDQQELKEIMGDSGDDEAWDWLETIPEYNYLWTIEAVQDYRNHDDE